MIPVGRHMELSWERLKICVRGVNTDVKLQKL